MFRDKFFNYFFFKDLTLSMCEMLHIHGCLFPLFHGLGKSLLRCEQLFQTQTSAPVPGQEISGRHGSARQAERRTLEKAGHLEEEISAGPHPDPAGVRQSLSTSGQSQNPIEADGTLSSGFYGAFWCQPSCFTEPKPGLVLVPITAICQLS